jgi:phospholipid/cholesterol/gamma-HCH transport system permease protein
VTERSPDATYDRGPSGPLAAEDIFEPVTTIGERVLSGLEEIGSFFILVGQTIRQFPAGMKSFGRLTDEMTMIGMGSLPLVILTSLFVGAVASVQAAYQFQSYVPMRYLGTVVTKSVVLELGPVLTALVVGGRVGASIAAELGTMKVTEQIDALETLAINPVRFLIVPRVAAAFLMLPMLTMFSDILAILGGWAIARVSLDVSTETFIEGVRFLFKARDVFGGLVKAFVFGIIIALAGCYYGMKTEGGAEGVGLATTKAVVAGSVSILVADYFLAEIIFRLVFGSL